MSIKRKIKKLYRIIHPEKPQQFYQIDGFTLDMGEGHMLSITQRENPMYDRFVPYLGKLAGDESEKWIVDIGANVGDTTAALIKHTACKVLCIEPTEKFYRLCKANIVDFGCEYQKRVNLIQAYVAQNENEKYTSAIQRGTAVRCNEEVGLDGIPSYRLSSILKKEKINISDVMLVKVDTDGYDSECIMSIGNELRNVSPFLYWENQIDSIEQYEKFIEMVDYLKEMGYSNFFVFDNFGNYMCEMDFASLKELNTYLLRIIQKKSTRSFYYVDVLAAKEDKYSLAKDTINEYLNNFI